MKGLLVLVCLGLAASLTACDDRPIQRGGSNPIRNATPEEQGRALGDAYLGLLRDTELLVRNRPAAPDLGPSLASLIERYTRLFRSLENRKALLTESDQTRVSYSVGLSFKNATPAWDARWLNDAVAYYQPRDASIATTLGSLARYVPSY